MSIGDDKQVSVELRLGEGPLADDVEGWLADHGALDVTRGTERGFLPLLPIFIAAVIPTVTFATLVQWVRNNSQCQVVIDARHETIVKEIDCRIRDGRIIVLTRDGERVEIFDVPPIVDFTEIITAVTESSGEAIAKAAEAVGAVVARTKPD